MCEYLEKYGNTALHKAAQRSDRDFIELLVDYDANIDAVNIYNETPLLLSVLEDNLPLVRYFLEKFANPNIVTKVSECNIPHF